MSISPVIWAAMWQELIAQDTSADLSFQMFFCTYILITCLWEKQNMSAFHLASSFGWASSCLLELRLFKKNCSVCHPDRRWAGKANASHFAFFSFFLFYAARQTPAHTNDIEINWCNDKSSRLATAWGENPPLQFQALHLAWCVMWARAESGAKPIPFPVRFFSVRSAQAFVVISGCMETELQGPPLQSPPMLRRMDNCCMPSRLWLAWLVSDHSGEMSGSQRTPASLRLMAVKWA